MLNVSAKYFRTDRSSLETEQQSLNDCLVDDVIAIANVINNLPEISSLPGGASGDKGWMSIANDGQLLYAYFMDGIINFEFFSDPKIEGCSYCSGEMSIDGFQNIVTKIDSGLLGLAELKTNAHGSLKII